MPRSIAASSIWGKSTAAYSDASIGSLSRVLHAADLQQQRSLRMLNNVSRQAELEADRQLHLSEKQAEKEERLRAFEALREAERLKREAEAAAAEEHRRARAEAAALAEEQLKEAARKKITAVEERAKQFEAERKVAAIHQAAHTERVNASRKAAFKASCELAEANRARILARQEAAERLMREKEEVKRLEASIKHEKAFLKEEARKAAKAKAESDLQQNTTRILKKGQAKDENLKKWHNESADAKRMKAQEARARQEYIQLQARNAAEEDRAKRAMMKAQAQSKAARADAIAAERDAIARQMQEVRHKMQQQECNVRLSLDALKRTQGSWRAPTSLAASLKSFSHSISTNMSALGDTRSRVAASVSSPTRQRPLSAIQEPKRNTASPAATTYKRVRPISAATAAEREVPRPVIPATASPTPKTAWAAFDKSTARNATSSSFDASAATYGHAETGKEGQLRQLLHMELQKESHRQAILQGMTDAKEIARIGLIFAAEREEAKAKILALSADIPASPGKGSQQHIAQVHVVQESRSPSATQVLRSSFNSQVYASQCEAQPQMVVA